MADFPFTLVPDAPSASGAAFATSAATFSPFADNLGFGITNPFRRGPADFVAAGGVELVQSMISQVLGTAASSDYTQGELPWRSEFGSLLHFLRHRNNDATTRELARVHTADALARWVPQVRLKDTIPESKRGPNGEETIALIRLKYDIVGLSRPGNQVLVPNVTQGVSIAA